MSSKSRRPASAPDLSKTSAPAKDAPGTAAASNEQMKDLVGQAPKEEVNALSYLFGDDVQASHAPTPGEHEFPWGGGVYVHTDGELLYMPPSNGAGEAMEALGFKWYGESGYMEFPKDASGNMIGGEYKLPNGGMLFVFNGEVMVDLPTYDHEAVMKEAGFYWSGETGYMGLP